MCAHSSRKDSHTDSDDAGVITREEFQDMNTLLVDSYLYEMGRSHPRHRERFSEQTWLTGEHEDGILQDIRMRLDDYSCLDL